MHPNLEYTAVVQQEREREMASARLARQAACYRACCNPTRMDRLVRAVRTAPAAC